MDSMLLLDFDYKKSLKRALRDSSLLQFWECTFIFESIVMLAQRQAMRALSVFAPPHFGN